MGEPAQGWVWKWHPTIGFRTGLMSLIIPRSFPTSTRDLPLPPRYPCHFCSMNSPAIFALTCILCGASFLKLPSSFPLPLSPWNFLCCFLKIMVWTFDMRSLNRFLSVQSSIVNCGHDIVQQISRTCPSCLTETWCTHFWIYSYLGSLSHMPVFCKRYWQTKSWEESF